VARIERRVGATGYVTLKDSPLTLASVLFNLLFVVAVKELTPEEARDLQKRVYEPCQVD
jgi:hypothetical protein